MGHRNPNGGNPMPAEPETLLRRPQVEALVGLSRSAIYKAMSEGTFPRPLKLGTQARAWRKSEIVAWIESRERS